LDALQFITSHWEKSIDFVSGQAVDIIRIEWRLYRATRHWYSKL